MIANGMFCLFNQIAVYMEPPQKINFNLVSDFFSKSNF